MSMDTDNMQSQVRTNSFNMLYSFYQCMIEEHIQIIYQGEFNQQIVKSVLSLSEQKMASADASVKKKVFNVMVECLQNICKHQYGAVEKEGSGFQPAIFMAGVKEEDTFVITGNLIANDQIDRLTSKIEQVNSLDQEGLKSLYKEARLNSRISEVGGAGLGLIDIARKSGNPILYSFAPAENNTSYFSLMCRISSSKQEN
jgi:Family of unknown function (DUF6272)